MFLIDTSGLLSVLGNAAALGGLCYLLLGQLFAMWPASSAQKAAISLAAPFVVAGVLYGIAAYFGAIAWDGPTAAGVAGVALAAALGAKTYHATADRVQGHLGEFIQVILAQSGTIFAGTTNVQGIVAGGDVAPPSPIVDARPLPDAAILAHLNPATLVPDQKVEGPHVP